MVEHLIQDLDGAFGDLVEEYQGTVFTTALRLSGRRPDAEDLAAEAFLRAYRALRGYPDERIRGLELRPWLLTIVLNLWRNQLRSASRRPVPVALAAAGQPATAEAGPERQTERRQDGRQLAELLAQLPEIQRSAVVLRHVVGLTTAELSQVLRCPQGTAKSHVSRGLNRLRTLITQEEPS